MTQRLSVMHSTSLAYAGEVLASFNEARMTPLSTSGQLMLRHDLTVSPWPGSSATPTTGARPSRPSTCTSRTTPCRW